MEYFSRVVLKNDTREQELELMIKGYKAIVDITKSGFVLSSAQHKMFILYEILKLKGKRIITEKLRKEMRWTKGFDGRDFRFDHDLFAVECFVIADYLETGGQNISFENGPPSKFKCNA